MTKAKAKTKTYKRPGSLELDSLFILKLVLFLILGSQWLYVVDGAGTSQLALPLGVLTGLFFAMHEHFKIDRKIEYALLLVAMFVGFWLPMGITIVR